MTLFARIVDGVGTMVSEREVRKAISFPRQASDSALEGTPFVIVEPTERPDPEGGDLAEDAPELVSGRWRQTWTVTPPTSQRLEELRTQLLQRADAIAASKMPDALTPADIILSIAHLAGKPVPGPRLAQIDAAVTSAGQRVLAVEGKLAEVRGRIEAATTYAEMRAIADELQGY